MKVAASADWRQSIPFETPMLVADLVPGEPTRCFTCGIESEPLERTDLWAFKHRHPNHHDGFVRFYCRTHVPVVERPEVPATTGAARRKPARSAAVRPERTAQARQTSHLDAKPRAMCPECFIEVSATGVCGVCGATAT